MKVVLTTDAEIDLESIADYIAQDNPARARSFVAEVVEKAMGLSAFPERFPLVSRYAASGVRQRAYRNYLIFYCIEQERISVLHILHAARDYEALLFPDE